MTQDHRFSVQSQKVLVTGGTRGIGFAIAKALRDAGADVYIHGMGRENTEAIAKSHGLKAVYADLRNDEERKHLVRTLHNELDRLDILFNNAGFEMYSPIECAQESFLDDIYRVNARSPFLLVRDLLDLLKSSGSASVINVTSIHQDVPVKGNSSYCMAKASLDMFTKVAALELAKWNIRVNTLAPGAIITDMNREIVQSMPFEKWIPLGSAGTVEDMVGPALFLASAASRYMTGATLVVDGGYSQNLLRYEVEADGNCRLEHDNIRE
ncbi:MAG: SDR family oxidoreductase [Candidatus Limiplasma sp.]|nr:SDR family oxidoreductase [Candidatus Limiplasma sp.]